MAGKKTTFAHGMTFVEVIAATLVVSVAATGVLSYGYHGVRQRRMARAQNTCTQVGRCLLEDWKGNGGSIFYARAVGGTPNPVELDMGFEYVGTNYKAGGVIECIYKVTIDSIPMRIVLSRPLGYLRLIELTVTVSWRNDLSDGRVEDGDPSVMLRTSVRIDQVGD
jgi:hypothetical protein